MKCEKNLKLWCIENNQHHLIKEWNHKRNLEELNINIEDVTRGSSKRVWWTCGVNSKHTWQTKVFQRTKEGTGCPYCAGRRVLVGDNDLESNFPNLAKEWDYKKNSLKPTEVTSGSSKKVWWICGKGHSWITSVKHRSKGSGCPYCAGERVLEGFNDLQVTHPELVKEWDYKKNSLKPTEVSSGSDKKVWWMCKKGHSWKARVSGRVNGAGCYRCSCSGTSYPEQVLFKSFQKVFKSVHNRKRINGYEYDIYIEDINLLIEYDGYYWHREHSDKREIENKKAREAEKNNYGFLRIREEKNYNNTSIKSNVITTEKKYSDSSLEKTFRLAVDYINDVFNVKIKKDFMIN